MPTLCIRFSDDDFSCPKCKSNHLIKNGFTANNKQQYRCKACKYRCIQDYTYRAYDRSLDQNIISLTKEGVGIRSTARLLSISTTTLLRRLRLIASRIKVPIMSKHKSYEIDEMRTFILRKDKPLLARACSSCPKLFFNE